MFELYTDNFQTQELLFNDPCFLGMLIEDAQNNGEGIYELPRKNWAIRYFIRDFRFFAHEIK